MDRLKDLKHFYNLLDRLENRIGGKRKLADCDGRMEWPNRGVYFFFESGENRSNSGTGPRVVRVGTHAITEKSRTSLWSRLSQHRGVQKTGGGSHRGSVFRSIIGSALKRRDHREDPVSWGVGGDLGAAATRLDIERTEIKQAETPLEQAVSKYIGDKPFLWLDIGDPPGRDSLRSVIERNSIALLSNFSRDAVDPPSAAWLGNFSDRERVRLSGLWNNDYVDQSYDPNFLVTLEQLIA